MLRPRMRLFFLILLILRRPAQLGGKVDILDIDQTMVNVAIQSLGADGAASDKFSVNGRTTERPSFRRV